MKPTKKGMKTDHSWGFRVLFQVGDVRSSQAAPPLHPDRRGFVSGAVGTLDRRTGHRTGHGRGAEQAPRPAANHRLNETKIYNLTHHPFTCIIDL